MTINQRNGEPKSDFSDWVRNNPNLDSRKFGINIMDFDWIIHRFLTVDDRRGKRLFEHIMFIEEKKNSTNLTYSQRSVMWFLEQLCKYSIKLHNLKLKNIRGEIIKVRFWGCYVLRYEGLNLLKAETIWWNKRIIDLNTLEKLILFEINPDTLKPYSERRHHPPKPEPLFDKVATL